MAQNVPPDPTVKSIRDALRGAMLNMNLYAGMHDLSGRVKERDLFRDMLMNFAAFGVNAGLISKEEYNDWKLACDETTGCAKHYMKWMNIHNE